MRSVSHQHHPEQKHLRHASEKWRQPEDLLSMSLSKSENRKFDSNSSDSHAHIRKRPPEGKVIEETKVSGIDEARCCDEETPQGINDTSQFPLPLSLERLGSKKSSLSKNPKYLKSYSVIQEIESLAPLQKKAHSQVSSNMDSKAKEQITEDHAEGDDSDNDTVSKRVSEPLKNTLLPDPAVLEDKIENPVIKKLTAKVPALFLSTKELVKKKLKKNDIEVSDDSDEEQMILSDRINRDKKALDDEVSVDDLSIDSEIDKEDKYNSDSEVNYTYWQSQKEKK